MRNDPKGGADGDCVLEQGDWKILTPGGSYQPGPERVTAERPRYTAEHTRHEAADHTLAYRAESSPAQGPGHNPGCEPHSCLPAGRLRQLVRDQLPDCKNRQNVRCRC